MYLNFNTSKKTSVFSSKDVNFVCLRVMKVRLKGRHGLCGSTHVYIRCIEVVLFGSGSHFYKAGISFHKKRKYPVWVNCTGLREGPGYEVGSVNSLGWFGIWHMDPHVFNN